MDFRKRSVWIYGFTLFSLFFGAGNLILPPYLGLKSGTLWWLVILGFSISAVVIPMLGILAHARLQGALMDFGSKVSGIFALCFSIAIYSVALTLPAPRTAAVTHEMAIAPYFNIPPLATSLVYFTLVFLVSINRSKIVGILGKWLSPPLLLILLILVLSSVLNHLNPGDAVLLQNPFTDGILEGYQTFDAIGAVVAGGVILISMRIDFPQYDSGQRFKLLLGAGVIAASALFLLYSGLVYSGSLFQGMVSDAVDRTHLVHFMSESVLGNFGSALLSILFALACFTTAVGIITGTADFVKGIAGNSEFAYRITAFLGAFTGVLIGQFSVSKIIDIAVPILQVAYPLTIVLILLNALPKGSISIQFFRIIVWVTLVLSLPEALRFLDWNPDSLPVWSSLPFQQLGLGWVFPDFILFLIAVLWNRIGHKDKIQNGIL
jgi:LIVCS family branched-chain amino acid:cation transporter